MLDGIKVARAKGVGDTVQFSSVPENYFNATGKKLIDVDKAWIFDHNPFVIRDYAGYIRRTVDMWNFSPMQYHWPIPSDRDTKAVYQCNAEIWARVWGVNNPTLLRPRLYQFEGFPFHKREKILLHTDGRSHGKLGEHVIEHVIEKYGPTGQLYIIGKPENTYGLPHIQTETLWDLAKVISEARMLIGSDSGPSWIAACYPDVIIKKVRQRPSAENYKNWVPLEVKNFHSHWDDRLFQIYNASDSDIGPFESYRKL